MMVPYSKSLMKYL